MIAIATEDGMVHVGLRGERGWTAPSWQTFAAPARYLAASDDLLVAACSNGAVWFYSPRRRTWVDLQTGAADIGTVALAPDMNRVATVDSAGRLIWIELGPIRRSLAAGVQP